MSQQLGQWGTIAGIKSIGVRSGLWLASFCLLSGVAAQGQTLNLETPVVPDRLQTANVMNSGAPLAGGYTSSPAPVVGTATMAGHVASGPYGSGPMVSGPMVEGPMVTDCNQCGGGGCDTCSTFGGPTLGLTPGGTGVWFRADYLIWWERDAKLP